MEVCVGDEKLKELLKSAIVEVLQERGDLLRDMVEEAVEGIALSRAIEEGMNTEVVARERIFEVLEGRG